MTTNILPKNYRRNFIALAGDFCFFGLAMAFIGPGTVVPSLLTTLGASASIIGLVSTIQRAGWMLPQLFAAHLLTGKAKKKPAVILAAAISRPIFLILAALLLWANKWPTAIFVSIFIPLYALFWLGDGMASLPWFDLLSKSIPPKRRGRLTSVGQTLSGLGGFIAGAAVEWMLGAQGPAFPQNYAWLFFIGFLMLATSFFSLTTLIEPAGQSSPPTARSWRTFVPQLASVFKKDAAFRRYILARQIYNLSLLATPFYMTYALDALALPPQVAGRYTSIGVVGSILAALAFGWLNEKHGTRRALQLSIALTTLVPLTALAIPRLIPDATWLAWGYGAVFFILNAANSSLLPAWMAYVLEHAPEVERPVYVGLTNTINGITTLFSTLGGFILAWTSYNYSALFIITAIGTLLAFPVVAQLPDPRATQNPQHNDS